jgi:cellulose synthase/poly-beta-1,6-N-acetylglucosamine synthase-like glycosyltransferase
LLAAAGLLVAVPVLTLLVQVLASLLRAPAAELPDVGRPRVAVLVPAHNEQFAIRGTLASISHQLSRDDRLVVVADNCLDHTAEAARQQGAEVTVRNERSLRGKGYALDHGLRFLERTSAPDVVIFVDADCMVKPGSIDRLARTCIKSMRPVQGAYLMNPPRPNRRSASMVAFAWKVRDFVRPLGWNRLSLPCQLSGSGMAFPWELVRSADLASNHLVEDLKQGLDLALAGQFSIFCPEAVVTSDVVKGGEPSYAQRARWEHGTIATTLQYYPRLLIRLCQTRSLQLLAVTLDLSIPPLALLALALASYLVTASVYAGLFHGMVPLAIGCMNCILLLACIFLAWWGHGQDILPFRWLAFAPVYALRKVPLYCRFFLDRQREWVRGERNLKN